MTSDVQDRLRAQLDAAARTAPPEPALGDVIDRCGRDLVRYHRRVTVAVVSTVAAVAAVAVVLPFVLGSTPGESRVANDGRPFSDAALIQGCREGSQPRYVDDIMFGQGIPSVAARSSASAEYSTTILVSTDGRYWADCSNAEDAYANTPGALADAPGRSSMNLYESVVSDDRTSTPIGGHTRVGGTCPQAQLEGCDGFWVSYNDRLPAVVGAVEFTTADDQTTRVDTTADGFVVFDHHGTIPVEYRANTRRATWLKKIVYLDHAGTPIAANRLEGEYLTTEVDGLPLITAYPSLAKPVLEPN